MKKVVLVIILSVCLLFSGCKYSKGTSDYNTYRKYMNKASSLVNIDHAEYSKELMPSLDTMGNFNKMYATFKHTGIIWQTNTVGLFLEYDKADYDNQVKYIDENYVFFENNHNMQHVDIYAETDGYIIKMVDREDYIYDLYGNILSPHEPENFGVLIGTNDSENKICYLYFCDPDLGILDDLDSYIQNNFYMETT